MYSISELCTVGLDRTDQAFPLVGRIEDLCVVKTVLPEDLKALATPRPRFPVSGSEQVLIFFLRRFRMAIRDGIMTLVDVSVGHCEAIAVTFPVVVLVTLHKTIASIISIRIICGVVV